MKRPNWVLRSFLLSAIFLSVTVIQVQNSRAEDEDPRAKLLKEIEEHEAAAAHHDVKVREHAALGGLAKDKAAACKKALAALDLPTLASIESIQNCSDEFLRSAPVGTRVSTTVQGKDGATLVGAIFERVQVEGFKVKVTWQQISADSATRGLIWSERIGSFTNDNRNGKKSQAEKECEDRGGRLPTIDEFKSLRAGFDLGANGLLSELGKSEFHRLFPDMKGHWFWSSSRVFFDSAFDFDGYNGGVYDGSRYYGIESVRCVR